MRAVSLAAWVVVLVACAHGSDRAGSATITSGTPDGIRVTSATIGDDDPDRRLAHELCEREATCGRIAARERGGGDVLGEEGCIGTRTPPAHAFLATFPCSAGARQARFEECLAAIRSERCETSLARPDTLPACRADVICAP